MKYLLIYTDRLIITEQRPTATDMARIRRFFPSLQVIYFEHDQFWELLSNGTTSQLLELDDCIPGLFPKMLGET